MGLINPRALHFLPLFCPPEQPQNKTKFQTATFKDAATLFIEMACIPISWIRSGNWPPTPVQASQPAFVHYLAEQRTARINTWLDGLIAEGCPPWDEFGQFLLKAEVGWFPVEAWTTYELYDFADDVGGVGIIVGRERSA